MEVEFLCTSSMPWHICRWKRPDSREPCGIFNDDPVSGNSRSCGGIWGGTSGGNWVVRSKGPSGGMATCSISSTSVRAEDAGEWNCELQSMPIQEEHDVYFSDQKYFLVNTVRKPDSARLVFGRKGGPRGGRRQQEDEEELDLFGGDKLEVTVEIRGSDPIPAAILWLINSRPADPKTEVVLQGQPELQADGLVTQKVVYQAREDHSGKKLVCLIQQVDSEGHVEETKAEVLLRVQAPPKQERSSVNLTVVAVIVSVGCFVLIALILLCVAFRTGRWCFKNSARSPPKVYVDRRSMQVQAESEGVHMGVSADFGPNKPRRTYSHENDLDKVTNESAPLVVRGGSEACPDGAGMSRKLERLLEGAQDETTLYSFEGRASSLATSLSTLNTDEASIDAADWEETFKAVLHPKELGPKSWKDDESDDGAGTEI